MVQVQYFREGILNRRLNQQVNRRDAVQNSKMMGSVFIAKCNTLPYRFRKFDGASGYV